MSTTASPIPARSLGTGSSCGPAAAGGPAARPSRMLGAGPERRGGNGPGSAAAAPRPGIQGPRHAGPPPARGWTAGTRSRPDPGRWPARCPRPSGQRGSGGWRAGPRWAAAGRRPCAPGARRRSTGPVRGVPATGSARPANRMRGIDRHPGRDQLGQRGQQPVQAVLAGDVAGHRGVRPVAQDPADQAGQDPARPGLDERARPGLVHGLDLLGEPDRRGDLAGQGLPHRVGRVGIGSGGGVGEDREPGRRGRPARTVRRRACRRPGRPAGCGRRTPPGGAGP